jgi:hypothetical protein
LLSAKSDEAKSGTELLDSVAFGSVVIAAPPGQPIYHQGIARGIQKPPGAGLRRS